MSFKRDALLYKQVSFWMLNLAYYRTAGLSDHLSLGIMCVGFFIGKSAYDALEHEGTYYGIEMELPQYKDLAQVLYPHKYGEY